MSNKSKPLIVTAIVIIALTAFVYFQNTQHAQNQQIKHVSTSSEKPVVIAYQTGVDPSKVAQANGDYEKNSQREIEWKKFDTGADVVNALASGDVDIGNLGTSPFTAAVSRDVPIAVFFIAAKLGHSEALVVSHRSGITQAKDLIGKTIAVPFVSTAHYSLLSALKHWNIAPSQVNIINLRPSEISAAWQRGDIDATYVWEPALSKALLSGKVLTDSQQVADWGAPTFDLWAVRQDFAEKNPEFLKAFVQSSLAKINEYNQNPKAFEKRTDYIEKIAALTGSQPNDIPLLLAGNIYLNQAQQLDILQKTFARNIFDTATFLKSQGKIDRVKDDYQANLNSLFLKP
ncbi:MULTISPECIES: taurine ABC transporter substrate-binding protein [unclassified Acinetobacter]|uniref:taurine ABC transporter substrate-binding protein n=1 Tax=unclassified Acinetobacter TaxID=196816 RepID=UPI0029341613|nr:MULTISPECIES: taurine ABC transporter substrate-binding protein [unclassified Acinetobacter]WOE31290.1 taurine ABC transporter substrate-binding protein [Acinetobacter sp. SAAs470]WOE39486.1 taurine ABC transporter substrate-binding protein [Acinetobacter sp. SAAs474]